MEDVKVAAFASGDRILEFLSIQLSGLELVLCFFSAFRFLLTVGVVVFFGFESTLLGFRDSSGNQENCHLEMSW